MRVFGVGSRPKSPVRHKRSHAQRSGDLLPLPGFPDVSISDAECATQNPAVAIARGAQIGTSAPPSYLESDVDGAAVAGYETDPGG